MFYSIHQQFYKRVYRALGLVTHNIAVVDEQVQDERKLYLTNGTWSSEPESLTQLISSWKDLRCAGRGCSVTSCTASLTLATNAIHSQLNP